MREHPRLLSPKNKAFKRTLYDGHFWVNQCACIEDEIVGVLAVTMIPVHSQCHKKFENLYMSSCMTVAPSKVCQILSTVAWEWP